MFLLKEVTKHRIDAAKNDETKFTWHGNILTSLTDFGLTIFTFSKDYRSFSKEINFVEHIVEHPKHSVTSELIPRCFVSNLKDNFNYTQLIVDPVLWPHNSQLDAEATRIISYEYAPTKFTFNNEYIITTLSSSGNVELLTFDQNKYGTKYNVTKKYLELKNTSQSYPKTSAQLKDIMNIYATSTICWQPNMINEYSCYFVTVQFNCDLLFWLITSDTSTISLELKFTHKLECTSILSAKWIPISKDKFHLMCCDITGQIFMLTFSLNNHDISPLRTTLLWEDQDKMVPRNSIYSIKDDITYLIFSKNRHLIIWLLDKNGTVEQQYIKNINDYKIVGIVENVNDFYVGTSNCKVFRFNILNPKLHVDITPVQVPKDINSIKYELQSIATSKDKSFLALSLLDLKLCTRKNKVSLEVVILNNKSCKDIIADLLNNPDRKLTKFWQSIEYHRHSTIKNKSMPDIDYKKLYSEAEQDVYKLKLYYLFLTWYHFLLCNFVPVPVLPEESLEKVREKILMTHAHTVLSKEIKKYPNCNEFEKEVLNGTKNYLLYYCNKYNEKIEKYIEMKRIENIERSIVYFCQSCDKEIIDFTCKDNHFSLLCILTFTVIEGDYLKCRHCNVAARIELLSSKPTCVFCDLPLSKSW